jgi:predicted Zn finger-like uncharacterized protein
MDVRCEQCGTEYELDEARLRPGGVTVKCTGCGHMFKIRKRTTTGVGPAPAPAVTGQRPAVAPAASSSAAMPAAASVSMPTMPRAASVSSAPPPGSPERNWQIRLASGEVRTARDLSALQAWIAAGECTPESQISRSGKSWKRLGDIPELRPFFEAATAAHAGSKSDAPVPTQLGFAVAGVAPLAAGGSAPAARPARPPTQPPPLPPRSPGSHSGPRPLPLPMPVPEGAATPSMHAAPAVLPLPPSAPPPSGDVDATAPTMLGAIPGRGFKLPTRPPSEAGGVSTGLWANDAVRPIAPSDTGSGPVGPTSGSLRGAAPEPAFSGRFRVEPDADGGDGDTRRNEAPSFDDDDDLRPGRPRSRAGLWIAIAALVVIAGAGAATYFLVLRGGGSKRAPVAAGSGSALGSGSGSAVVAVPIDVGSGSGAGSGSAIADEPAEIVAARAALLADTTEPQRVAIAGLAASSSPTALALRARLLAAQGQALLDEASLAADDKAREALRRQAKQLAVDAVGPAQRAIKAEPDGLEPNLAMAAVLRLQDKPEAQVRRHLDAARAKASTPDASRELALADALLALREAKLDDALALLRTADPGAGGADAIMPPPGVALDVRPRVQAVLIAIARADKAGAAAALAPILVVAPSHRLAAVARDKVAAMVDPTDPMPVELGAGSGSGSAAGSGSGAGDSGPAGLGDNFDRVLAKADQLAKERGCGQAMPYYQRALELKSTNVEALTGAGFCHLDGGQFASAYSKFNAALAISPRFERALWGMAEAYQQQGNDARAIEAYQRYLDAYPGSAAAKKQLQRLGVDTGGGGGSSGGSGSGSGTTTEPPKDPDPPKDPPGGGGDDGGGGDGDDGPTTMPE